MHNPRSRYSWALYDWANSAFATTVMAAFFPIFWSDYWSGDLSPEESTFWLGAGNSIASLVSVILAPIFGAMADAGGLRKRMLAAFACLGTVATAGLFLVEQGAWPLAILLYGIASVGFRSGNVFYDALLVLVAPASIRHRVSALGFALGYLGGGLLFLINVAMTLKPTWFGLADAASAVRWSFLTVGVWWLVFSLPLFLWVDEPLPKGQRRRVDIARTFAALAHTFRHLSKYRATWAFLFAYWLYIDGVDTIVVMAADYGKKLGFETTILIGAILMIQFIAFPAALVFGRLGERYGPKRGIWIAIVTYMGVTAYASIMTSPVELLVLAAIIGLVQGGIQSLSRSLFSLLIPQDKNAEFFGFYNVVGKAAAVIGPILVGFVTLTSGNPRMGIASILILFALALVFFKRVEEPHPH